MIEDTRNLFRGLDKCIEATTIALRDADPGPDNPTDYEELKRRLELAVSLPRPYRKALVEPLQDLLTEIGPSGFARALLQRHADLALMDVAQAIPQRAERYVELATAAFQEVVADLYDGFPVRPAPTWRRVAGQRLPGTARQVGTPSVGRL